MEKEFKVVVKDGKADISDGYHTFEELYDHRCWLFAMLTGTDGHNNNAWKSTKHADGSCWPGWFIAGINLATGTVTYHLPMKMWDYTYGEILERAPVWDGHTSAEVLERFKKWLT